MTYSFEKVFKERIKKAAFSALTTDQINQLLEYLWIFKSNDYSKHWEVNNHITENDQWDDFKSIRSLNDHGYKFKIRGIIPKYYAIACSVLDMSKGDGARLEDYERY